MGFRQSASLGALPYPCGRLGGTANNRLGRSQCPDPYFDRVIDEFRICNAGLSAAEIAAPAALGASQQSRTNLMLDNWLNVTSLSPQIIGR
jgi:hypothetical protein